MTEPDFDDNADTGDDNDERYVQLTRAQIRTMERDAKLTRQAQDEANTLRRDLALARSGIGELSERQQKALFATIDGEITAEVLREAAQDLGFVKPLPPSTEDTERAQLEGMSHASSGAADPGSEDSIARLHRAAREGGKEALLAQIQADGHVIEAAG
jgi:hypothetical protein